MTRTRRASAAAGCGFKGEIEERRDGVQDRGPEQDAADSERPDQQSTE
jgi:hypothetical protein